MKRRPRVGYIFDLSSRSGFDLKFERIFCEILNFELGLEVKIVVKFGKIFPS